MKHLLACLLSVAWVFFSAEGLVAQNKEHSKTNLVFGKSTEAEITGDRVPGSVASGSLASKEPVLKDPKTSQDGEWLRIDVPFSTSKKITPEIKFKFLLEGYEVVEAEAGGKDTEKFVVLSGEITYRDVPQGTKHFAGMFLPPSSVVRFAGLKANGQEDWKGKRMNLRVEAWDQGNLVEEPFDLQAEKEKGSSGRGGKKDPDWHKAADAQEVPGALLPINETPFWPKDYKHYPQLKKI